jgi:hypothetical protein
MNYVSFSVWGDKPIYNVGVIKNADLMVEYYPDWKMVVYYNDSTPKETIELLNKKCYNKVFPRYFNFWRILEIFCFRYF